MVHRARAWDRWWTSTTSPRFSNDREGRRNSPSTCVTCLGSAPTASGTTSRRSTSAHTSDASPSNTTVAVSVLVVWYPLPRHRFWVLSLVPRRSLRKRRREQDLELALEVRSHLDGILSDHPEISGIVWMTDDEAAAYSLSRRETHGMLRDAVHQHSASHDSAHHPRSNSARSGVRVVSAHSCSAPWVLTADGSGAVLPDSEGSLGV
jgi:hypothetical protein